MSDGSEPFADDAPEPATPPTEIAGYAIMRDSNGVTRRVKVGVSYYGDGAESVKRDIEFSVRDGIARAPLSPEYEGIFRGKWDLLPVFAAERFIKEEVTQDDEDIEGVLGYRERINKVHKDAIERYEADDNED